MWVIDIRHWLGEILVWLESPSSDLRSKSLVRSSLMPLSQGLVSPLIFDQNAGDDQEEALRR